jgi:hypothetical protein
VYKIDTDGSAPDGVTVATQVAECRFVRIATNTFFVFSGISTQFFPQNFASDQVTGSAHVRIEDVGTGNV